MPAVLVSVYRRHNVELVRRLVDDALGAGWRVALWALDDADRSSPGRQSGRAAASAPRCSTGWSTALRPPPPPTS